MTLLEAHFDSNEDGFSYIDDPFRGTTEPSYADGIRIAAGGFTGGALQVTLGGIDNADILGMSGGWQTSFTVSSPTEVVLSFRYNLTQASNYEADELSQVLVSVDGILYGEAPNDYVAEASALEAPSPCVVGAEVKGPLKTMEGLISPTQVG